MANVLFLYIKAVQPNIGGIGRITYTLGELFRTEGHKVWYVATGKSKGEKIDKAQIFLTEDDYFSKANYDQLSKFILDNKIDVIINQIAPHKPVALLFERLKEEIGDRIKLVNCFHTSVLTPAYNYAYQVEYSLRKKNMGFVFHLLRWKPVKKYLIRSYIKHYRDLYKEAVESADVNVVLNEGQKEELCKMIGVKSHPSVQIIPNCIPAAVITDIGKENMVLWCGNFSCRVKRPDLMIDIWNHVSKNHTDWKLVMAGDGPDFEEMKSYAVSNKVASIEFTGRVNPEPYFEKAKIVCITSSQESFSLVAVEGMQHEAPVVLFNSFTMASKLVENGLNGYLIDNFDKGEFEMGLSTLMADENKRIEMGKNASKKAEEYLPNNIFYTYWNNIISN